MKVALIQMPCVADPAQNRDRLAAHIATAARGGAELVVLQELHNTPYFCQTENTELFDLAEPIPGPSTAFFGDLARRHAVVLVTSLFERRAPGLYHNTAVVFERDGSIAGKYRKMHIPDDPAYYEKFYFTPGDLGFGPIDTSVGRLGVQVCWDQWYPEGARLMALRGAELLIYPTAIGYESSDTPEEQARQREAWTTVQRGHAVANGLPVIAVNRVGHEPDPSGQTNGILFWGSSFVAGPQGELLFRADTESEGVYLVDIDMQRSENVRRWWPFLRDRRVDEFAPSPVVSSTKRLSEPTLSRYNKYAKSDLITAGDFAYLPILAIWFVILHLYFFLLSESSFSISVPSARRSTMRCLRPSGFSGATKPKTSLPGSHR